MQSKEPMGTPNLLAGTKRGQGVSRIDTLHNCYRKGSIVFSLTCEVDQARRDRSE